MDLGDDQTIFSGSVFMISRESVVAYVPGGRLNSRVTASPETSYFISVLMDAARRAPLKAVPVISAASPKLSGVMPESSRSPAI